MQRFRDDSLKGRDDDSRASPAPTFPRTPIPRSRGEPAAFAKVARARARVTLILAEDVIEIMIISSGRRCHLEVIQKS